MNNDIDFEKVINEVAADMSPATPKPNVSKAVVKRLPRYFRYLRELIRAGKMRISSEDSSLKILQVLQFEHVQNETQYPPSPFFFL